MAMLDIYRPEVFDLETSAGSAAVVNVNIPRLENVTAITLALEVIPAVASEKTDYG